jgi:hypothetical protein
MSRPGAPGRAEPALVAAPGRDAAITAVVVALTACAFAAAGGHRTLASIQRLDDAWLRLMISGRVTPLTVIAKVFNVVGHQYVTLPVRIAIAGLLALRRWWWHLAAFAAAMVISEVLIGLLKGIYSRARPPGPLVATSGASFPSGHAVAASVTAVAAVIALVPAGRHRAWWAAARCGVLDPDGTLTRLPERALAVRRSRRDLSRNLMRPGTRLGGWPGPAAADRPPVHQGRTTSPRPRART